MSVHIKQKGALFLMKFNLGQRVKVVQDKVADYFTGCEGVINYISKGANGQLLYGIELTMPNRAMDIIDLDAIYNFEEDELESITNINDLIQFM